MIPLILRAYFKNQLTVFDVERNSHREKLKEIFTSEEIENVIGGKIIRNLIRMDRLNSTEFRQVEECVNNGARNILKDIDYIKEERNQIVYKFRNNLIVRIKT